MRGVVVEVLARVGAPHVDLIRGYACHNGVVENVVHLPTTEMAFRWLEMGAWYLLVRVCSLLTHNWNQAEVGSRRHQISSLLSQNQGYATANIVGISCDCDFTSTSLSHTTISLPDFHRSYSYSR